MYEKKNHDEGSIISVRGNSLSEVFENTGLSLKLFRPDEQNILAVKNEMISIDEQNITTLLLSYINTLLEHINGGYIPESVSHLTVHPDMRLTADVRFAHVSQKALNYEAVFTDMCIEHNEQIGEYSLRFVVTSRN